MSKRLEEEREGWTGSQKKLARATAAEVFRKAGQEARKNSRGLSRSLGNRAVGRNNHEGCPSG